MEFHTKVVTSCEVLVFQKNFLLEKKLHGKKFGAE